MAVFISYSHSDAEFVDTLVWHLVASKARVWIDKWEINVGDSLIRKIKEAIQKADALVTALSKASVQSEWCKKELTAGLVRELEERQVLVLTVLLEDPFQFPRTVLLLWYRNLTAGINKRTSRKIVARR